MFGFRHNKLYLSPDIFGLKPVPRKLRTTIKKLSYYLYKSIRYILLIYKFLSFLSFSFIFLILLLLLLFTPLSSFITVFSNSFTLLHHSFQILFLISIYKPPHNCFTTLFFLILSYLLHLYTKHPLSNSAKLSLL